MYDYILRSIIPEFFFSSGNLDHPFLFFFLYVQKAKNHNSQDSLTIMECYKYLSKSNILATQPKKTKTKTKKNKETLNRYINTQTHFSSSMASSTRYLNTCILILALIFVALQLVHGISEGRKMKFVKQKELMHTPNDVVVHRPTAATLSSSTPYDFSPTNPGRSPGVGHKAKANNNNKEVKTVSSSTPDDFSPTNPGRSPGVGHGKKQSAADDLVSTNLGRSPGIGHKNIGTNDQDSLNSLHHPAPDHTLSSSPDDFKPTNPGRSPGVGHSIQTMRNKPNQ